MLQALLLIAALGQTEPFPAEVAPVPEPAPAPAPAPAPVEAEPPKEVAAPAPVPEVPEPTGCDRWQNRALGEGPIALGYVEADVATGRRACPRTEVGIGARVGAIIDTPNFYGVLAIDGLVYGSVAVGAKTEIFGTLEVIHWNYVAQNGPLKIPSDNASLGTLTLGATRQFYGNDRFLGALSARLLLPTSYVVPNVRLIGAEVGHAATWRPRDWLEVHSYLGIDFSAGLGSGPSLPHVGGVLTAGLQVSPFSFAAVVLDATGRMGTGGKSYFAPTLAIRLRILRLGIELAGTIPLAGSDRHDFIVGARFTFRI